MSQRNPSAHDLVRTKPSKTKETAPAFLIPMFKLPLLLYRLRLGWLLGRRFMLLTHVGRRSGSECCSLLPTSSGIV